MFFIKYLSHKNLAYGVYKMFKKLFFVLTILLSFQLLSAEDFFPLCSDIKNEKNYAVLNKYLLETNTSADTCQRLNNHEFIMVSSQHSNFYYCHIQSDNFVCEKNQENIYHPNVELKLKFVGANGKKFALFESSRLSHGIHGTGYTVFYFTPKQNNPRGYNIFYLADAGEYNGLYSEEEKACSYLNNDENAIELKNIAIVNEGKTNVGIRFTQKITSCKTNKSKIRTLEYMWTGESFKLSK